MTAAVVAEGAAVFVLALLVFKLLRVQAALLRLVGPLRDLGSDGPNGRRGSQIGRRPGVLRGVDFTGRPLEVDTGSDETIVLLFLTTACGPCQSLWGRVSPAGPDLALDLAARLVIVTPGPGLESRRRLEELAPGVTTVMSADAWATLQVSEAPFALVIRNGSVVAESPIGQWGEVTDLLRGAASG